ncbi:RNA-guided endonuclease InsQ/TnpB family protein [Fluviispira vulneris]|uniref:RNA-guided endonuclease InsQ/TnpB family protein n=1 Tax=Fluviispira vulneris TaxID=2763012 RepID=UPI001646D5CA|nr:RNA-guided endonuclease TnpB family protein [Fluviispira vulneris]
MITTYHYRIKDSGRANRVLSKMSRSVNLVWNFCKQTQQEALKNKSVKLINDKKSGEKISIPYFFSSSEMDGLVAGSSKELGLHSQTVQAISQEYITRRKQFKTLLRWRGKKFLGWIPFKASAIKIHNGKISYNKNEFSFWNSRELPEDAKIKTGSFCQDKSGHWYLNVAFESELIGIKREDDKEIGIDIGIKTLATCSNGEKIERPNLRKNALAKLRYLKRCQNFAQRKQSKSKKYHALPKAKQERKLHVKVANIRQDYLHKESTKLVKKCSLIVVGDVPCKLMNRNKKLSGISLDSGIGMFKSMLKYKAVRAASTYKEISERDSSRTCSKCSKKLLRIELGVRHWNCEKCGAVHDRDVNAAINILQSYRAGVPIGHDRPTRTKKNSS